MIILYAINIYSIDNENTIVEHPNPSILLYNPSILLYNLSIPSCNPSITSDISISHSMNLSTNNNIITYLK
ncbi:unnamed protein product [Rotaria sordida]|uniref:Uncharacterized protein n=1 Tax=Rotaria sordida TaxID=392033 RepID=A0A815H9H1_9BILA|nr:unnamed protein product [Rotaria sordida]CAF3859187.1 unnamed protein product [Rotaria sordida]